MSYALLGTIAFDLLNAPTALDEKRSAVFAQHDVLSGKPKLQAMGLGLTEITLQLALHHQLGDVEARYDALVQAKENQTALALVFGFTQYKGNFVITELSSTTQFTDEKGNALAREVSLTLLEFIGNVQTDLFGSAVQLGSNSLLGSILSPKAMNLLTEAKTLINKGIRVYRQAMQVAGQVRSAVATIKQLATDPVSALAELPSVLSALGVSTQKLGEMVGLGDSLSLLAGKVAGVPDFMRDVSALADEMGGLWRAFQSGFTGDTMNSWVINVDNQLEKIDDISDRMEKSTAKMTAWIAVRADFPEADEAEANEEQSE